MTYEDLIKFLEKLRDTKKLKFHTARTRITAIRKIFDVLPEFAKEDVLGLDLKQIQQKFIERYGDEVSLPTVVTYISRIKSTIKLYKTHTTNIDEPLYGNSNELPIKYIEPIEIQIRDEVFVKINNLPKDLKKIEVERIYRVLEAYINEF